jgi:hypothetical protein
MQSRCITPRFVVSMTLQSASSLHIHKMSTPREVDAGLHCMQLQTVDMRTLRFYYWSVVPT